MEEELGSCWFFVFCFFLVGFYFVIFKILVVLRRVFGIVYEVVVLCLFFGVWFFGKLEFKSGNLGLGYFVVFFICLVLGFFRLEV